MKNGESEADSVPISKVSSRTRLKPEAIGPWSEVKLDVVEKYAAAYSRILSNQSWAYPVYIDAFSGMGVHMSRTSGDLVLGSPIRVLEVFPRFGHYYFIDLDETKTAFLSDLCKSREDVTVLQGDCNEILESTIIPEIKKNRAMRALCLLDPYGIHYKWSNVEALGKTKQVDLFMHFSILDINLNLVRNHPEEVPIEQQERMKAFWGDESWRDCLYGTVPDLFDADHQHRTGKAKDVLLPEYLKRLRGVAGFANSVEPLAFNNDAGHLLYYMLFASPKGVATKIVKEIFDKYR